MIDSQAMAVIDKLEAFQQKVEDAWNVPREEGMLLHAIVLAGGCRKLVEVGTSYGFSGLFLAAAAKANGGELHTFDINPRKHEHAEANFRRAGLADCIRLHLGDATAELVKLDGGVDFAFLDATKEETFDYWHALEPKLAPRCIVTLDNVTTHRTQLATFVHMLRTRGDFTSCPIPIGNGLELAVRTEKP